MTEIAIEEKIVDDRDALRKLSPDVQKEIQEKAAKRIKERSENENIIVDTHCTINTPSGFLPGLPIWVLNELQPNLFVMIEGKWFAPATDAPEAFALREESLLRGRDGLLE